MIFDSSGRLFDHIGVDSSGVGRFSSFKQVDGNWRDTTIKVIQEQGTGITIELPTHLFDPMLYNIFCQLPFKRRPSMSQIGLLHDRPPVPLWV